MNLFDLTSMRAYPLKERDRNVFYSTDGLKMRIIELKPADAIPPCEMAQHVIFTVISGAADITVDGETAHVVQGHCVATPPATVSMKSPEGARIMAVQTACIAASTAETRQ